MRDYEIERYLALEWIEHGLWLMSDCEIWKHLKKRFSFVPAEEAVQKARMRLKLHKSGRWKKSEKGERR